MDYIRYSVYFLAMMMFFSCGKVADDISGQAEQSVFKEATIIIPLGEFSDSGFNELISTNNMVLHYSYLTGISFEKGQEKVGWVEAEISFSGVSSNSFEVTNFDTKKNTITSARYQQGVIKAANVGTGNYQITSDFKKIRPKYDMFAFAHYLNLDDVIFYVTEDIPSEDIVIDRYEHLISAVFLKHIQEESYNDDSIIPLEEFKTIIPTAAVTPTLNIYSKNSTRFFRIDEPIFQSESDLYDSLLAMVTLTYHSDEIDVKEYIQAQDDAVFSDTMKVLLTDSVTDYFLEKTQVVTGSIFESL